MIKKIQKNVDKIEDLVKVTFKKNRGIKTNGKNEKPKLYLSLLFSVHEREILMSNGINWKREKENVRDDYIIIWSAFGPIRSITF